MFSSNSPTNDARSLSSVTSSPAPAARLRSAISDERRTAVKVGHQPVARVVVGPATLVVHARTAVIAFAPIVPSGVVHKPSRVLL